MLAHTSTHNTHTHIHTHINTYIIHICTHTTDIHTTHIDTHNTYSYAQTHKCTYSHILLYRYTKHTYALHPDAHMHSLTHTDTHRKKEKKGRKVRERNGRRKT